MTPTRPRHACAVDPTTYDKYFEKQQLIDEPRRARHSRNNVKINAKGGLRARRPSLVPNPVKPAPRRHFARGEHTRTRGDPPSRAFSSSCLADPGRVRPEIGLLGFVVVEPPSHTIFPPLGKTSPSSSRPRTRPFQRL